MEEKVGLGIRNWDFSKQTVTDHAVLRPVSGIPVSSSTNTEHHPHHHHHQHQQQQPHQHQHPHPQPQPHLHPQQHQHHQAAFLKMSMYPNIHSMISDSEADLNAVDYSSHCWVHQRSFLPSTKGNQTQMHTTHINTETGLPVLPTSLGMPIEEGSIQDGEFETKSPKTKRQSSTKKSEKVTSKVLKTKEPKKKSAASTKKKLTSVSTAIREKKNLDIVIDGSAMDFSQVPSPVCSCTGMPRQCYRWGVGGWQSSCCTTNLSEYPLPMSSTRPGSRLAGRKMSIGAYGKLLQRLTVEGYDLSQAIDLKDHWAKHGTNKFVTIR